MQPFSLSFDLLTKICDLGGGGVGNVIIPTERNAFYLDNSCNCFSINLMKAYKTTKLDAVSVHCKAVFTLIGNSKTSNEKIFILYSSGFEKCNAYLKKKF